MEKAAMTNMLKRKNVLYSIYLFIAVSVCLELILHIYNPFHFRVKGNEIILQANKRYLVDNSRIPVLDPNIVHSKNGIGFRGPEKPSKLSEHLSIITIGGSTTECAYLDDNKTWSHILYRKLQQTIPDVWLNNAGLAGHSTFGHIALVKDHILSLKPNYVLLLVGANDIGRGKMEPDNSVKAFLSRNSELINVIVNLLRTREAKKKNLDDTYLDLNRSDSLVLTESESTLITRLAKESEGLQQYKARLTTLIDLLQQNNTHPILITQPSLVGDGIDPQTGVSLESIKLNNRENGKLWWTVLEKYNDVTRDIAREKNLPLIDLAHLLPKSSRNFYDIVHFTNDGAANVASIIYDSLVPVLRR